MRGCGCLRRTASRLNTRRKVRLFRREGYPGAPRIFSQDGHRPVPLPHTDILFALVGDVRLSSRALRQLRWLSAEGLTVEVLTFGPPATQELAPGVRLRALPRPQGRGPAFFWAAHRLFASAARRSPARLYHASDLYTLPALAGAAKRHGAALLYDSRELFPHVDATVRRPWARLGWDLVERWHIHRCDAVITVNDSLADRLSRTYGIARPAVVRNVPPPAPRAPRGALRERLGSIGSRTVVLYQGLFREGRGLRQLIRSIACVPDAHLVLIGDGPLRGELEGMTSDLLRERATLLPFTPPDELRALTAAADLGICFLEPITESLRWALPNKLFEYLAAGVPVIVSDLPELASVVRRFEVGMVVPHGDPDALTAALRRAVADAALLAHWRANTAGVFEAFDPEDDRRRLVALCRHLLA